MRIQYKIFVLLMITFGLTIIPDVYNFKLVPAVIVYVVNAVLFLTATRVWITKPLEKIRESLKTQHVALISGMKLRKDEFGPISEAVSSVFENEAKVQQHLEEVETLNAEMEKLTIAIQQTENAIAILSPDLKFEWINNAYIHLHGLQGNIAENLIGHSILEFNANTQIQEIINHCKKDNAPVHYENFVIHPNHQKIWMETTITPVHDERGAIMSFVTVDADITEIKEAEEKIRQHEEEIIVQNQELIQQKEEIQAQAEAIEVHLHFVEKQRDEIGRQKKDILDSIFYAKRIQTAILPQGEMIAQTLPQHFILFKPRDIVSGDYYWIKQKNERTIVVAADCTGHGVPGAFMSILGTAFLNEIVMKNEDIQANQILDKLREYVINSLNQSGHIEDAKDGMDIALCIINSVTMEMEFSGAYNPLYLVRNGELLEYKADKMPIGIYDILDPFSLKTATLQENDIIYIFSDGYHDQFGGPDGKKFLTGRFKKLLQAISDKPMYEQRELLDVTIEKWMAHTDKNGHPYEQTDDVMVVGVKISHMDPGAILNSWR